MRTCYPNDIWVTHIDLKGSLSMRTCYLTVLWVTNMFLNDLTIEKEGQYAFLEKGSVP